MKTIYFLALMIMTALYSCQSGESKKTGDLPTTSFNEGAEIDSIMKVIENETNCFFDGDYDCWASNWSHEPYTFQGWNNSDGSSDAAIGWDKINTQGKDWIETYYKNGKNIIHPVVKKEKPLVKFFGEKSAYLIWKQYNADQDKKYYRISQETRIMEKQKDGWKIVNVSAFWDAAPKISFDSLPPMD